MTACLSILPFYDISSLGNIFAIQMGPFSCVVLNGYDLISEALLHHHENLLRRPKYFVHEENSYTGIVSLRGHRWKEQRAFLQSTLRNLGMGRNIMGERIRREADYLLATINKAKGEPTDINNLVTVCVNNVVSGITFGKRDSTWRKRQSCTG